MELLCAIVATLQNPLLGQLFKPRDVMLRGLKGAESPC